MLSKEEQIFALETCCSENVTTLLRECHENFESDPYTVPVSTFTA
jgi:hypothetical protein